MMLCASCHTPADHVDRDRDGLTYLCCGSEDCNCLARLPYGRRRSLDTATNDTLGMPGTVERTLAKVLARQA